MPLFSPWLSPFPQPRIGPLPAASGPVVALAARFCYTRDTAFFDDPSAALRQARIAPLDAARLCTCGVRRHIMTPQTAATELAGPQGPPG